MTKAGRVHSTPPKSTSVPASVIFRPAANTGELSGAPVSDGLPVAATHGDPAAAAVPAAEAPALYLPTGISPEEVFTAIGRLRKEALDEIDRLLAFLDATDGDADLEPSLGFAEVEPGRLAPSHAGAADDREEEDELEASLGAPENHGSQVYWASGGRDDREHEHDGREPDVDDELSGDEHEPLLGSFDRFVNQEHAWRQTKGRNWDLHTNNDLEADPCDRLPRPEAGAKKARRRGAAT